MSFHILIVDDEKELCVSLSEILTEEGYPTSYTSDPRNALAILERDRADLIIMDIRMPELGGIDLLRLVRKRHPNAKVIMLTGHPSIENAVLSMKYGAVNFYEKPPKLAKLLAEIREYAQSDLCRGERATEALAADERNGEVITKDPRMLKILQAAVRTAATSAPVLITGETGTGKELIASLIHRRSPRTHETFVKVNCAAIPESLQESELFGHEKGAFTNAVSQRKGKFELADNGTVFLDEIGDMMPSTQAKILRVLQEQEFERVGGSQTLHVDLRFIAATNKDLLSLIRKELFREDLFYRLCVITLDIPPLRERPGDVDLLIDHFLRVFGAKYQKSVSLDDQTRKLLVNHPWPGNIRELKNCIERATIFCDRDRITIDDLPSQYLEVEGTRLGRELATPIEELSRKLILEALEKTKGQKTKAAEMLNINRRTLYNRMKKLGLD